MGYQGPQSVRLIYTAKRLEQSPPPGQPAAFGLLTADHTIGLLSPPSALPSMHDKPFLLHLFYLDDILLP